MSNGAAPVLWARTTNRVTRLQILPCTIHCATCIVRQIPRNGYICGVYVCACVCVCVCMYVCLYVCVCVCMCVCVCVCVFPTQYFPQRPSCGGYPEAVISVACICVCVCVSECVCMYVCACVCVYVYVYPCVFSTQYLAQRLHDSPHRPSCGGYQETVISVFSTHTLRNVHRAERWGAGVETHFQEIS